MPTATMPPFADADGNTNLIIDGDLDLFIGKRDGDTVKHRISKQTTMTFRQTTILTLLLSKPEPPTASNQSLRDYEC